MPGRRRVSVTEQAARLPDSVSLPVPVTGGSLSLSTARASGRGIANLNSVQVELDRARRWRLAPAAVTTVTYDIMTSPT